MLAAFCDHLVAKKKNTEITNFSRSNMLKRLSERRSDLSKPFSGHFFSVAAFLVPIYDAFILCLKIALKFGNKPK